MLNREKIISFLKEKKEELFKEFSVEKLGLFGSYALGSQTDDSDIDIIVSMPSDYKKYYALKKLLEESFNKKVDLGLEHNIRLMIKDKINNEIIYV